MDNLSIQNRASYDKTENGTSIIPTGQETNKDLFIKLLVGQMTNQDPFNTQDPTQYVTQLAQFSMLEQIMSLNDSMDYLVNVNNGVLINSAMTTASSLIGKNVEMSSLDENGKVVDYCGEVKGATVKDGRVYLEVKLEGSEEIKEIEYENLVKVS